MEKHVCTFEILFCHAKKNCFADLGPKTTFLTLIPNLPTLPLPSAPSEEMPAKSRVGDHALRDAHVDVAQTSHEREMGKTAMALPD